MDKGKLIKKEIVTKKGHFVPLVFVDLSVPTAAVGAACTYAGRSINEELKDGKKYVRPSFEYDMERVPLKIGMLNINSMLLSIDDINI